VVEEAEVSVKSKYLHEHLVKLREFTKDCRVDMHEPDEQGITGTVLGRGGKKLTGSLDNAQGEFTGNDQLEFVVRLTRAVYNGSVKPIKHVTLDINLATLIAIARAADIEKE
jgi:hypothetical protein